MKWVVSAGFFLFAARSSRCTATLQQMRKSWNLFTWAWISIPEIDRLSHALLPTLSFLFWKCSLFKPAMIKVNRDKRKHPVLSCPVPSWLPTKCSTHSLHARFPSFSLSFFTYNIESFSVLTVLTAHRCLSRYTGMCTPTQFTGIPPGKPWSEYLALWNLHKYAHKSMHIFPINAVVLHLRYPKGFLQIISDWVK